MGVDWEGIQVARFAYSAKLQSIQEKSRYSFANKVQRLTGKR